MDTTARVAGLALGHQGGSFVSFESPDGKRVCGAGDHHATARPGGERPDGRKEQEIMSQALPYQQMGIGGGL
jgi:hypothetical protein